jgi:hypothetical protein
MSGFARDVPNLLPKFLQEEDSSINSIDSVPESGGTLLNVPAYL